MLYLNDIDHGVYAFWHSILNDTDRFCRMIAEVPVTIDTWRRQREVVVMPTRASLLELGFAFFFLNRTNRSGIITGGVIGGQEQTGKWKIAARFNKKGLIQRIQRIAGYRDRIRIFRMDAGDFLCNIVAPRMERSFVYADPPYYRKGQALYENHYDHEDHEKFRDILRDLEGLSWVVSYDDVPKVRQLYRDFAYIQYNISYSAAARYAGQEVMFFAPTIQPFVHQSPLSLKVYA